MRRLRVVCERTLALALVCGLSVPAFAQSAPDGDLVAPPLVERVDASGEPVPPPEPTPPAETSSPTAPAEPSYWIGILGGEVSPALRSHLGLEGAGVLVREVVKDSPADTAGIREHDVLLTANGEPVTDMSDLANVVAAAGERGSEITVDLLRTGAQRQVVVTPAERHAPRVAGALSHGEPGAVDPTGTFGAPRAWEPFNLRVFGPGVPLGGANVNVQGPHGTRVQVRTENGETRVTVQQGDKTWELDGADPESLEQLPPELRPTVEGLLAGRGVVDLDVDLEGLMPRIEGLFGGLRERRQERLNERLERMERLVEELRERLGVERAEPRAQDREAPRGDENGGDPALEEAPPFNPDAPPAEIEIPAVDED